MKILITGCARSGTTIMTHMMRYFYSTKVEYTDERHPFDYLHYNDSDHVLVIKKPYLEHGQMGYFSVRLLLSLGWRVVWMLRDGRDVITSPTHKVSPERWEQANDEFLPLALHQDVHMVRYEDLVQFPIQVMNGLSEFIGQSYQDDYADFWKAMDANDPMNIGINPEPLHTDKIGRHLRFVSQMPKVSDKFNKLQKLFGYE